MRDTMQREFDLVSEGKDKIISEKMCLVDSLQS